LFARALDAHAARDTSSSIDLTRRALEIDPEYVEALEHLATTLITRRQRYDEGLALIERAVSARDDDAGIWYALGWCYEFAAHDIARRPTGAKLEPRLLYERAAEGFRRCLELHPDGKLQGDAEDLLDHVENELSSL
jgi:tetratricopeptide (TPR) repeat protein